MYSVINAVFHFDCERFWSFEGSTGGEWLALRRRFEEEASSFDGSPSSRNPSMSAFLPALTWLIPPAAVSTVSRSPFFFSQLFTTETFCFILFSVFHYRNIPIKLTIGLHPSEQTLCVATRATHFVACKLFVLHF